MTVSVASSPSFLAQRSGPPSSSARVYDLLALSVRRALMSDASSWSTSSVIGSAMGPGLEPGLGSDLDPDLGWVMGVGAWGWGHGGGGVGGGAWGGGARGGGGGRRGWVLGRSRLDQVSILEGKCGVHGVRVYGVKASPPGPWAAVTSQAPVQQRG